MYTCILWCGSHLPLPKSGDNRLLPHNGWTPLFTSTEEIPLYWLFLLDRFNCFWLNSGAPIFVVDRSSAVARAEERYLRIQETLLPRHCEIWQDFLSCLKNEPGDIFNIQIDGLWHKKLLANRENFDTYLNRALLPLEGTGHGSRQQQARKKSLMTECLEHFSATPSGLCGVKKHRVQPLVPAS